MSDAKVVLIVNRSNETTPAIAREFARNKFKVVITFKDATQRDKVIEPLADEDPEIFARKENCHATLVDLADEDQIERVMKEVELKFGRLDVLVNNIDYKGSSEGFQDEALFSDFQSMQQINLCAPVRFTQLAASHLKKGAKGGVVITVLPSLSDESSSCVNLAIARAGLEMMTKGFANSFAGANVRCLTISPRPQAGSSSPTGIRSEVGRANITTPEDMAKLVVFMASDKASYINGTIIEIN